jgi:hypothetical protein
MAVYVDNYNAKFGRMTMCHMVSDTTAELLLMVDKIGVNQKWIQYPGTYNEHFDICLAKKKMAIYAGAVEISARDYARFANAKKTGVTFTPGPLSPIKNELF